MEKYDALPTAVALRVDKALSCVHGTAAAVILETTAAHNSTTLYTRH